MLPLRMQMRRIRQQRRLLQLSLRQRSGQWLQQAMLKRKLAAADNGQQAGSFHEAVAPVLVTAQCFGLMPVLGVNAASPQTLEFQWRCWRTWCSILYICLTASSALLTINWAVHSRLDVRNMEPIVFHVCVLLSSYRFLHLARQWPVLMRHWSSVEHQMPRLKNWNPCRSEHLATRIRCVAFSLMALALVEHSLSILSAIYFDYCPARKDVIESYFYSASVQLFYVVPYANWLGWLSKIHIILLTFGWSYVDIFLMVMGIGLGDLLARLTRHIHHYVQRPMPEIFWTYTRIRYRAIVELILDVDNAISGLMIISLGSNLYFICLQLLKSIYIMPSTVKRIYFYYSLFFLIGRSLCVMLFVSSVHERARKPLQLLRLVPPSAYHEELHRFASELANDQIALSGLKFFNITRRLVLTVAGSIVTYELVLIQFNEDKKSWDCDAQQ